MDKTLRKFTLYLETFSGERIEVRRVKIDANNLSFEKLNEKLHVIFPDLHSVNYKLQWIDGTTVITISSDEELTIALEDMAVTAIPDHFYIKMISGIKFINGP